LLVTGRLIGEAKAVAKTLARTAPADFQPTLISDFFTYSRKNHKSHYQPQGSEPGSGAAFVRPQCE
jgi:hypothetical protein